MKIIDVSVTVTNDLVTWPGDPSVHIERASKIEDGANANVSHIDMGAHTGTHVDAPFHFLPQGSTVERLPLDVLIGPVEVVQIPDSETVITAEILKRLDLSRSGSRILFKTRNSTFWPGDGRPFQTDFVGIDASGAEYLVNQGTRLVGIDYLSISPYHKSRPTHVALLSAGIVIIEGLDLSQIQPGKYMLYCLPVKLGGTDGAPARAILIQE
ncbi:MAG: cyclase family protein [Chloroflexi bacterium]|nr:cyclase family protein [Chloroflexota bacterium]